MLGDEGNSVEFLHQLGVLIIEEYLKVCDQNDSASESYRSILAVAHQFAFECSNGCWNIYTKEGKAEKATSPNVYVMRSILKEGSMEEELWQCLNIDSSINVKEIDGNDISVTWVFDASTTGGTIFGNPRGSCS